MLSESEIYKKHKSAESSFNAKPEKKKRMSKLEWKDRQRGTNINKQNKKNSRLTNSTWKSKASSSGEKTVIRSLKIKGVFKGEIT